MKRKRIISFTAAIFILPFFFMMPFFAFAAGTTATNSPVSTGTSLNWAGYEATGGTFTSVGASWIIPQSTAPATNEENRPAALSADATWVGIGGVASRDLIQAGTQTVFQNGVPSYQAWYEMLPDDSQQVPLTVHPGDAMTVSLSQQSTGQWNIYFYDSTTGQSYNTSVSYQSSLSSAEWIEEMPSATNGFVALDNFGTAAFTGGFTVENGTQLSIAGAGAQSLTMINSASQALAVPSSLGADGASFSVTRTGIAASTAAIAPMVIISRGGYGGVGSSTSTGRWTRTGVGVQGYTPSPERSLHMQTGGGYVRIQFGNFPALFRMFQENFRDERDR